MELITVGLEHPLCVEGEHTAMSFKLQESIKHQASPDQLYRGLTRWHVLRKYCIDSSACAHVRLLDSGSEQSSTLWYTHAQATH